MLANKIVQPETKPYVPSPAALNILEILRGLPEGVRYKDLKRLIRVSDTHLGRTLDQLEDHGALNHVEGLYLVTRAGLMLLGTYRGLTYTPMDFVPQQNANVKHLVPEIRKLHAKLLREVAIPGEPEAKGPFWICVNNENYDFAVMDAAESQGVKALREEISKLRFAVQMLEDLSGRRVVFGKKDKKT